MKSTTYYVSSLTGNDENDGLTPSTPFASLNKINEISLCAGDKVLLERGSVFENQFLPQLAASLTCLRYVGLTGMSICS